MSKHFRTAIAGTALLAVGAALAQEPGQSQSQEQQSKEQRADATDSKDMQSQTDKSTDKSQSSRQARASGAQPVMMMLLIPVSMESKTDNTLANGCWAKLYDNYNYGGDSFTLVGPLDLPKMIGPFGVDWDDKVSSIKTGPKATVTIYDNENFRDRAAKIKPAQEVPQLTEKMGLFEDPNSMRINCGGATAAN